ncbi:MAG TPA: helix-turn-helix domain-containing protein [Kineosporiaceae bacterium]
MTAVSAPDVDPLLKVRDAIQRLNMGRSWLYESLATGRIRGVRLGRSWRIPASVVEELARTGLPTDPV